MIGEELSRVVHRLIASGDTPLYDAVCVATELANKFQAEERYMLSADRQVLTMYVTVTDPVALTEPFTAKRFWYWAPDEVIDPYLDCEIPTDYIESLGE